MKKSRKPELDSNSEQIHQSDTYCPSVERALFKQCKLEELLVQSQLKKAGIQTAEALIKVLYEEIRSLKNHKQTLETQISMMLRQFSQKEEHLKQQIMFLQNDLKQVMQMRELRAAQMRDINSRSSLSKCFLPNSSRKLSVPKSYKSIEKRVEHKSQYHESPIRKMSLIETVSKQYVEQDYEMGAKLCQEAVTALLSEDLGRLVVDFQEIADLIWDEKDQLMQYIDKHQQNEYRVKQLSKELKSPLNKKLNSYQNTSVKIKHQGGYKCMSKKQAIRGNKVFSTQNSNQASPDRMRLLQSWQDKIKQQSKQQIPVRSIIKQYQDIIQQYKQYSAYLRAYLCSCINFMSKSTQEMAQNNTLYCLDSERLKNSQQSECLSTDRSNNLVNFPCNRVFEIVLRDILTSVEDKIHMEHHIRRLVEEQNKQLRLILDQLVENLKKSGIKTNTNTAKMQLGGIKTNSNTAQRSFGGIQTNSNTAKRSYGSNISYEIQSPMNYQIQSPMSYQIQSPQPYRHNETVNSKQLDSKTQSQYGSSVKKRSPSYNQKYNNPPYKKSNQPPKLHTITLTEYKRYHNQQQ